MCTFKEVVMKRIISLILVLLLVLPLIVACDGITINIGEINGSLDVGDVDLSQGDNSEDSTLGKESEADTDGTNPSPNPNPDPKPEPEPEPNPNPAPEPNPPSSDTDIYPENMLNSAINIEHHDYGGKEIYILVRDNVSYYREWYKKDGDAPDTYPVLDETIVLRNSTVENDLNIKPVMCYENGGGGYNEILNSLIAFDVTEGFHQFDIVNNYAYFATDVVVRDAYANVKDSQMFPYFNFKLPCWNQALIKNTTINNKLYMLAGDVNLSLFDLTTVMWVNLDLYKKYQKNSDPADIQQHAIDGNWVYQDLYSWALRTENTDTKTVCGDFHGFSTGFHFFDTLPHAWDLQFVITDNDGRHSFNVENNTKAEDALQIIRNIIGSSGCAPAYGQSSDVNICKCGLGMIGHFADGDYAFVSAPLYGSESQNLKIRNMTAKYGILPIPQYEAKTGYKTTSADYYNLMAVLNHNDNLDNPTNGDEVSVYLQYVNEKSYTDVREMYFERVIRSRTFGTDEVIATKSIEIFNTIIDGISLTVDTVYSRSINDIGWLWRDNIIRGGTTSLGAAFLENSLSGGGATKTKEQYEQALAEFDAWIFDED